MRILLTKFRKEEHVISKELLFLILLCTNFFIVIYSIYQFIDNLLFFGKEGSKLKIKKSIESKKENL